MNTKILKTTLTTGLFVAAFGISLWEAQLARLATANLASALNRQSDLMAAERKTQKSLFESSRHHAELADKLAMLQSVKKRLNSFDGEFRILAAVAKPWREIVLNKDPKLQVFYLKAERATIPTRYAPFVASLGLSPENARSLEEAVMAATERKLDISASAQSQGLSTTDPAVSTLLDQSDQALKNAIEAVLGDGGYEKLQDYQRTLPTREFVNGLAGELAFSNSPLSGEQADLLVSELSGANSSYQGGGIADSPRFSQYQEVMATKALAQDPVAWDSIASQVQGHLSDAQFALLNSAMQDSSSTVQLYNMMQQVSDAPIIGFSYSRKTH